MLHWGSMRCTVGSSMYSKARLPGVRPRSTRRVTGTKPAPVTDGAEKHTISEVVLLEEEEIERNGITDSSRGAGGFWSSAMDLMDRWIDRRRGGQTDR